MYTLGRYNSKAKSVSKLSVSVRVVRMIGFVWKTKKIKQVKEAGLRSSPTSEGR